MSKIKIQSKMKALNLNRQGLLLLLFCVFTSCDKLLPPPAGGTGKLVPVRIRSVSVKGYGEAPGTRSAGGEKRIVGQPIVQDLGNGMFAEISVEEEVSALRSGDPLDNNVVFRVIAVDSNNKVYSYGDYKVEENTLVLTNNTNLHVLNGVNYDYIFISFNNSTLPPPPTEGKALPATITVTAGANDLLYKRLTSQNVTVVDNIPVLKFNDLTHQLARVKLVLDANTDRTITNIVAGSITLNAASSFSFNLTDGEISDPSGTTNFSGWGAFNQQKVTSNTSTFLESAEDYTFSFSEGAVTLSENSIEKSTTAGSVSSDNFTFKAGSSYTVTLRILKKIADKFAGSNIYWDSANSRLTFDEHGNNDNTKYQGVFFKWGSLIGIAAGATGETYTSGSTVLYKPTNPEAEPGTARTWTITIDDDEAWNGSGWANIPSYDGETFSSDLTGESAHTLLKKPDFTDYKGDICNYINPAYRMPALTELAALGTGNSSDNGTYKWTVDEGSDTSSDATGQRKLREYGTFTGISGSTYYLPASGYHDGSDEMLYDVGSFGYYWSGSAYSWGDAYRLEFYKNLAFTNANLMTHGLSVRCVKN